MPGNIVTLWRTQSRDIVTVTWHRDTGEEQLTLHLRGERLLGLLCDADMMNVTHTMTGQSVVILTNRWCYNQLQHITQSPISREQAWHSLLTSDCNRYKWAVISGLSLVSWREWGLWLVEMSGCEHCNGVTILRCYDVTIMSLHGLSVIDRDKHHETRSHLNTTNWWSLTFDKISLFDRSDGGTILGD